MTKNSDTAIEISLTVDEAVVLFEFVRRFSESDQLTILDQAEQRALWNLCCIFERGALSSIEDDWSEVLQQARNRLRDAGRDTSSNPATVRYGSDSAVCDSW